VALQRLALGFSRTCTAVAHCAQRELITAAFESGWCILAHNLWKLGSMAAENRRKQDECNRLIA
jgi:hypothetical protein